MAWNGNDSVAADVIERGFTLESDGRQVPGVYWRPVGRGNDRLVLLGHGGTAHKKADYIEIVAKGLCSHGIAAVAIDGPGHGDRPGADDYDNDNPADFPKRWKAGGGTEAIVADWASTLDFIENEEGVRTTGWWGLSMGTMVGLPVSVADERIKVAVLGLMGGWGPNGDDLTRLAPDVSIPVRYLVQWDDELVPRDKCIELFGALGSERKTMHVNPGAHSAVPAFEVRSSIDYLVHQLTKLSR